MVKKEKKSEKKEVGSGFGIAGLICGIISLFILILFGWNSLRYTKMGSYYILISLPGLILSAIHLSRKSSKLTIILMTINIIILSSGLFWIVVTRFAS